MRLRHRSISTLFAVKAEPRGVFIPSQFRISAIGHTVSEAAILEACAEVAQQVEPINQATKEELKATEDAVGFVKPVDGSSKNCGGCTLPVPNG